MTDEFSRPLDGWPAQRKLSEVTEPLPSSPPPNPPGSRPPVLSPAARHMDALRGPAPARARAPLLDTLAVAPAPVPRPVATKTTPKAASRLLHPVSAGGPGQFDDSWVPATAIFTANPALRLAQLMTLGQGALALITGVSLIQHGMTLAKIGSGVNLATSASLARNYGIGIVIVGALFILGAMVVAHPSQIIRTLLTVFEVVALGLTLAAHFGGGSVLGFWTVVWMGSTGSALIPFAAMVGGQSAVIYLLAIHPPTYKAFAR